MLTPRQIKEIRDKAGLSQAKAAKLIGATTQSWHKWEHGYSIPSPVFMEKIMNMAEGASVAIEANHERYMRHVRGCPECQTLGFRLTRAKLETEWQG